MKSLENPWLLEIETILNDVNNLFENSKNKMFQYEKDEIIFEMNNKILDVLKKTSTINLIVKDIHNSFLEDELCFLETDVNIDFENEEFEGIVILNNENLAQKLNKLSDENIKIWEIEFYNLAFIDVKKFSNIKEFLPSFSFQKLTSKKPNGVKLNNDLCFKPNILIFEEQKTSVRKYSKIKFEFLDILELKKLIENNDSIVNFEEKNNYNSFFSAILNWFRQ